MMRPGFALLLLLDSLLGILVMGCFRRLGGGAWMGDFLVSTSAIKRYPLPGVTSGEGFYDGYPIPRGLRYGATGWGPLGRWWLAEGQESSWR